MKLLSKITPAETILIKECGAAQLKNLLRFTFMDLLLKRVIKIVEVDKQSHPRDEVRSYTYVESGENFNAYKPKKHELIFTSHFVVEEPIQILFKHFVKIVYDASDGKKSYRESIKSNTTLKDYFNQSFFINLFRFVKLTDEGEKVKKEITIYLKEVDENIGDLLANDQKKALELLLTIGGNILLLQKLDFEFLKKIDKELLNQQKTLYKNSDHYNDGWCLFDDYYLFDNFFDNHDSFDSFFYDTLDSFDSEFDASSCSSCDSGCSSCGGCGGCD